MQRVNAPEGVGWGLEIAITLPCAQHKMHRRSLLAGTSRGLRGGLVQRRALVFWPTLKVAPVVGRRPLISHSWARLRPRASQLRGRRLPLCCFCQAGSDS